MGRFGRVLVQDIRYTKHKKDSTPFEIGWYVPN